MPKPLLQLNEVAIRSLREHSETGMGFYVGNGRLSQEHTERVLVVSDNHYVVPFDHPEFFSVVDLLEGKPFPGEVTEQITLTAFVPALDGGHRHRRRSWRPPPWASRDPRRPAPSTLDPSNTVSFPEANTRIDPYANRCEQRASSSVILSQTRFLVERLQSLQWCQGGVNWPRRETEGFSLSCDLQDLL